VNVNQATNIKGLTKSETSLNLTSLEPTCAQNRQVFSLYRLIKFTMISYIGTLFKVQFIQASILFRVRLRQVSL